MIFLSTRNAVHLSPENQTGGKKHNQRPSQNQRLVTKPTHNRQPNTSTRTTQQKNATQNTKTQREAKPQKTRQQQTKPRLWQQRCRVNPPSFSERRVQNFFDLIADNWTEPMNRFRPVININHGVQRCLISFEYGQGFFPSNAG